MRQLGASERMPAVRPALSRQPPLAGLAPESVSLNTIKGHKDGQTRQPLQSGQSPETGL